MPNTETSCEAATNCSNSAGFSSRTCDGCYPNPAMSSNWRASLVPAAAVIPAPRAYTDIAAVKTLVVNHWVAGLSRASLKLLVGPQLGQHPWQNALLPIYNPVGETCSCTKPPSVGVEAVFTSSACLGPGHSGSSTMAHNRSPPTEPPWKTQCA